MDRRQSGSQSPGRTLYVGPMILLQLLIRSISLTILVDGWIHTNEHAHPSTNGEHSFGRSASKARKKLFSKGNLQREHNEEIVPRKPGFSESTCPEA